MSRTAANDRPAAVKPSGRAAVNSKTMVVRGSKARSGLAGAFEKPKTTPKPIQSIGVAAADSPESERKIAASSAALRDQIKAAKVAARRTSDQQNNLTMKLQSVANEASPQHAARAIEQEQAQDPFNQRPKQPGVLRKRVDAARTDGTLNIAALGLKEIPEEVMNIYDFDANAASSVAWGEVVDLNKFLAADNELQMLPDELFPDVDPEVVASDDEAKGPQFGGVEVMDLHGNMLRSVPAGLRWMERLTILNLVCRGSYEVQRHVADL